MSGSSTPSDATMPGRDDDARLEAVLEGETPASPTPLESRIADLVAASRHPGSDDELAGLDAALTAFATGPSVSAAAVGATAGEVVALATASGGARSRRRLRRAGVVGVAGVVLLGSATAAAAAGGHLPRPLQQIAHSAFGAPAPEAVATATGGGSSPRGVGTTADPSGSGATTPPGTPGTPAGTPSSGTQGQSAAGLCRAWRASGGPASNNAAVVRVLVRLAGSREAVPAFCTGVLATAPGKPSTTPKPNGTGKPSTPPGKPTTTPKPNGTGKPSTPPGKPSKTPKPKPNGTGKPSTPPGKPTTTPTPKGTGKPSTPPGKPSKTPKPSKTGKPISQPQG